MNVKLVGSILGALFAFSAHATEFSFNSGYYEGGDTTYFVGDGNSHYPLQLLRRGSQIRVKDLNNDITYSLDLNNPGEQEINPKVIRLLRRAPETRVIGHLIDHMSISQVNSLPNNKLNGMVNVYLKTRSIFGWITATMQIGVEITSTPCKITKTSRDRSENFVGSCMGVNVGTSMGIVSLQSSLEPRLNNAIGLIGDFVVKLYSTAFSTASRLSERR